MGKQSETERDEAFWTAVEADYRLGLTLKKIAQKHGLSVGQILHAAKKRGWTRAKDDIKREHQQAVVAVVQEQQPHVKAAVEQAIGEVMSEHKGLTRTLRDEWAKLLLEYQNMLPELIPGFSDRDTIARLHEEGDDKALREYLKDSLMSFLRRADIIGKLTDIGARIIDQERVVWGLKNLEDIPAAPEYDDLLELVGKPTNVPALPDKVVNFEAKLRQVRGDDG